jgi:hypothetical protein
MTLTNSITTQAGHMLPPLPLFAWAARQEARSTRPAASIRLFLLDTCLDADGQPRAALSVPGSRMPKVYPTLAAALAAKIRMETAR